MNEQHFRAESLRDLEVIAAAVLPKLRSSVVLFYGAMGAGKTTFIAALCRALGVEESVSSPSFALINEYHSPEQGPIYHCDWYRLESPEEALEIGLEEYLYSGAWCLMEWPEKIANFLPSQCDAIFIKTEGDARSITVKPAKHE